MARRINEEGLAKLKQWEGCKLVAYKDDAGVWTIGYGSTRGVKEGQRITQQQAENRLLDDLKPFERRVETLVKVPLTDNQFSALVSFDFNTGSLHSSTLLKKLNAGDYEAVPRELMKWVKITDPKTGKKRTLNGLVNRRSAEVGLWVQGAHVETSNKDVVPYDKPVLTKEALAVAAGAVPALGTAAASGDGPVQYVIAGIIAVSFALAAFWYWNKRKNPK